MWAARKGAFGAVGRLLPDVMIQDAVVPRSRLPEVLAETYRISAKYNLQLANVFHAGDGNLHPLICFDLRRGDDLERVRQAGREIMETCVRAGGSITGEHGVGLDKSSYLPLIFSDDDMTAMLQVRAAFDPSGLCNPGKIIPTPKGCGEARAVATQNVTEPTPVIPFSLGEGKGEGVASSNFFHLPSPLPKEEGAAKSDHDISGEGTSRKKTLITARMNEARITRELSEIVGDIGVRRLPDFVLNLQSNARAERMLEVAPGSAEQACQVMKFASQEGLAVIPAGASTWLDAGNLMAQADLILSTRRLKRIIKHEPADLVAQTEAGVLLSNFKNELATAGQWLPISAPDDGRSTLGGIIATGLAGANSLGYGNPRSFVIGLRAVLADARLIKAGGNVVKNVAGYDLCKLFTGSYGTLGFITELSFKLRPLPPEARTVLVSAGLSSLISTAREVAKQLFPNALELLSRRLSKQMGLTGSANDYCLLIHFEGSARGPRSASTSCARRRATTVLPASRARSGTSCAGCSAPTTSPAGRAGDPSRR